MKYVMYLLLSVLVVLSQPLDGFEDIFVTYGKRTREIKKVITEALNTDQKKWKERGLAYPRDTYMSFAFIPRNQYVPDNNEPYYVHPYGSEFFIYTEYDTTKDKRNIRDISSLFANYLTEKKPGCLSPCSVEKILFQNDKEIRSEACVETGTNNRGLHLLTKSVHLGGNKFISYEYYTYRNLSPEEINYWFQMFDYIKIDPPK